MSCHEEKCQGVCLIALEPWSLNNVDEDIRRNYRHWKNRMKKHGLDKHIVDQPFQKEANPKKAQKIRSEGPYNETEQAVIVFDDDMHELKLAVDKKTVVTMKTSAIISISEFSLTKEKNMEKQTTLGLILGAKDNVVPVLFQGCQGYAQSLLDTLQEVREQLQSCGCDPEHKVFPKRI